MTLPVFVVDTEALASEVVELVGDEGHHAVVVRRLRVGEHLVLTDGRGQAADCEVTSLGKSSLHAAVRVRRVAARAVPRLTVVQAIPKGDHAERAVDLLTEVGADVIVPWAAARNVVSWKGDRAAKALQRWRSTAVAAAKQSRRLWFPDVLDLHSTAEVLELIAGAAASYVLHETARTPLAVIPVPDDLADGLVLVVGPEGGVTDEELAAFASVGAEPVRLGPEVLRSSSAGLAGAAVILSRTRWP